MGAPRRVVRDYYSGFLMPSETISDTTTAVAGGAGTHIGRAAAIGVLAGWLYAIYLDAPLLPSYVLGGLVGVIVGYVLAARKASQPDGPGAVHLVLVKTSERLLAVRRYPILRHAPLRSYPIRQISSAVSAPLPVGRYERLVISMADGTDLDFIVDSRLDITIDPREHKSDFGVD